MDDCPFDFGLFESACHRDKQTWWEQCGFLNLDEYLADEEDGAQYRPPKIRKVEDRPRAKRVVVDYWAGPWGKMLKDPNLKLPGTRTERLFRRRFRVPYPVFCTLLAELREDVEGNWGGRDATRLSERVVPLELKLMGALRVLGRGEMFDTISELAGFGETTVRAFFHKFTKF